MARWKSFSDDEIDVRIEEAQSDFSRDRLARVPWRVIACTTVRTP